MVRGSLWPGWALVGFVTVSNQAERIPSPDPRTPQRGVSRLMAVPDDAPAVMRYQPGPWVGFARTALRCVLALAIAAPCAHAGPPFITDDPVPVELTHWEIYIAQMMERWSHMATGSAPQVEVNYGAIANVQLHVIVPLSYAVPSPSHVHYGLGDIEMGVKYRFVEESANRPQIATFPLLEIPTGNSSRGLGNGHEQVYLPLWAEKSHGEWTIDGGGGYWINPGTGNRNYWYSGLMLQRQIMKPWMLGLEVYHTTASEEGASGQSGFNLGSVYDASDHIHVMASLGRTFTGSSLVTSYTAIQLTF